MSNQVGSGRTNTVFIVGFVIVGLIVVGGFSYVVTQNQIMSMQQSIEQMKKEVVPGQQGAAPKTQGSEVKFVLATAIGGNGVSKIVKDLYGVSLACGQLTAHTWAKATIQIA